MSIWQFVNGPINWLSIFCNILIFVVPISIYNLNHWLHKYGDPIWKDNENKQQ